MILVMHVMYRGICRQHGPLSLQMSITPSLETSWALPITGSSLAKASRLSAGRPYVEPDARQH
jgi:hypothetical protein